jgi:hypothetical protein
MTQAYLVHLYENYPNVSKFFWTVDDTAFQTIEEAKTYSKIIGDGKIMGLAWGGRLEEAEVVDIVEVPLGNTQGAYLVDGEAVLAEVEEAAIEDEEKVIVDEEAAITRVEADTTSDEAVAELDATGLKVDATMEAGVAGRSKKKK